MSGRYFYGWNVVAATFVMALFSFRLGFYGLSVYVATLQRIHGWSASGVSAPVTVYYVAGALLTRVIGVAALGSVTQPWQLYPTFLVMSLGWGAMSGAAVNIILAPWFERRRDLAVSVAFNGATLGGVTLTPALYPGGRRLSGGQFLGRGAEFREGAFRQQGLGSRTMNRKGDLLLPNAWDAASARIFEEAGYADPPTSHGLTAWRSGGLEFIGVACDRDRL